jgi:hypothetical protein
MTHSNPWAAKLQGGIQGYKCTLEKSALFDEGAKLHGAL